MKVEKILDEMQASLTKLRGHYRETETAEECTCDPPWLDDCKKWMNKVRSDRERRALGVKLTPDPLHVRVAKALGLNPFFDYVGWCSIEKARKENLGAWCYATENHRSNLVPDYPNDLVAAMGALEEYCRKIDKRAAIEYFAPMEFTERLKSDSQWTVTFGPPGSQILSILDSLPQAICEAIVKHAEQP